MVFAVYVLCALASLACAVLLLRAYVRTRVPLLLWSGLAFVGFAINNVVLVVNERFTPDADLALMRTIPALVGIALLVYGLVFKVSE